MKTFLSIGTGEGIGFETAKYFAENGFRVILSSRNQEKLQKLASQLIAEGYHAHVRIVDAANPNEVQELINDVSQQYGIDTIHYNAALMKESNVFSTDVEEFGTHLTVDFLSAYATVHTAVSVMPQGGNILFTGGAFGVEPNAEYLAMSVDKAAVRMMVLGLFETLKLKNIHIGTVTVYGANQPNTDSVKEIGKAFYDLSQESKENWQAEVNAGNGI